MSAGDPTAKCSVCGNFYFPNNGDCDCKSLIEKFTCLFENPCLIMPTPKLLPRSTDIGVIVGRFQCSHIHTGYKELFDYVLARHQRVFVFVGHTPVKGSKHDPLPFQARRAMIEAAYPTVEVFKIDDVFDIDKWSRILDGQIDLLSNPGQKAVLYGSRDHFKYTGKYPVEDVPCLTKVSSTEIRKEIGLMWQNDQKWREGVIWLSQNRFPVCYPTVDIAVIDFKNNKVLLGRKPGQTKWRFPGGFADKGSPSYEIDALRELKEETSLYGTNLEYIGSNIIEDPRFKNQDDKIKTLFYAVTAWNGESEANDDLEEVRWFDIDTLSETDIVPTHHVLLTMFMNWRDKILAVAAHIKK